MPTGSIPPWSKKFRSSVASTACTSTAGRSSYSTNTRSSAAVSEANELSKPHSPGATLMSHTNVVSMGWRSAGSSMVLRTIQIPPIATMATTATA
ncbi:MAG: hypothetical protein R2789_05275 [Microthrixaceae bacterium]